MGYISALAYLAITVPDVPAWRECAEQVFGLQTTPGPAGADGGSVYFRMDERAWRLAISEGEPGLSYFGLEVASADVFASLLAALDAAGVAVTTESRLAEARGVRDLARVSDPAGNVVEFVYGVTSLGDAFTAAQNVEFVTTSSEGQEIGLGHIVLGVPDLKAAKAFYIDLLGFRVSDVIGTTNFLHTNPRHHSLAIGQANETRPAGLGHFMLQVANIDMVGRALDRVEKGGAVLSSELGRHTNDHMLSFYVLTPSGLRVEYGCGAREVDDVLWTVGSYDRASAWGHKRIRMTL